MYAIHVMLLLLTVLAMGETSTNRRQPFGPLMCEQLCQRTRDCSSFYFSASLLSCQLRDQRCQVMSAPYMLHVVKKTLSITCHLSGSLLQGMKTTRRCVKRKPKGYATIKYGNKVMFTKLYRTSRTWNDALKSCQSDGGVLVQPKTKAYEKRILKKYPEFGHRRIAKQAGWIGMVDDPDVDNFHWVDGDSPNHDNWGPGDPSHKVEGQKENCVSYWSGKWFDASCQTKQKFLCEICVTP